MRIEIDTNIYIDHLTIHTDTFAQSFKRPAHAIDDLDDEEHKYFDTQERLSDQELAEIDSWPDTIRELFDSELSIGAKAHFLSCVRGVAQPNSTTETIVAKLIHQALALGGLHCRLIVYKSGAPKLPQSMPVNDIDILKALALKSFLQTLQAEMTKIKRKVWREQATVLNRERDETYNGEPSDDPDPSWSDDEQLGAPFGPSYDCDHDDYNSG